MDTEIDIDAEWTGEQLVAMLIEDDPIGDAIDRIIDEALEYYTPEVEDDVRVPRLPRRVKHNRALSGTAYIADILGGHPERAFELFRVTPAQFVLLRDKLVHLGLESGRDVGVDEQLGIFLYILGHGEKNRCIQEFCQRSGSTVSTYFHRVLRKAVRLQGEYIEMPRSDAAVPSRIYQKPRFYPAFEVSLELKFDSKITLRFMSCNLRYAR